MKKLLPIILLCSLCITTVNGSTTTVLAIPVELPQDKDYVKIKINELPQPVKKALEDKAFKGWLINAAFKHKSGDNYKIEMKNGADRKVVKFRADGRPQD